MKQHLVIEGMTCEACKAKIKYLFEQHKTVELAHVDLASGRVTLDVEQILSDPVFESILLGHDKYSILQEVKEVEVESFWITYKPLLLVAIFVAVVSATAVLNSSTPSFMLWMRYFMAGFLQIPFACMIHLRCVLKRMVKSILL
jgi:copper chaperone CopZ